MLSKAQVLYVGTQKELTVWKHHIKFKLFSANTSKYDPLSAKHANIILFYQFWSTWIFLRVDWFIWPAFILKSDLTTKNLINNSSINFMLEQQVGDIVGSVLNEWAILKRKDQYFVSPSILSPMTLLWPKIHKVAEATFWNYERWSEGWIILLPLKSNEEIILIW